MKNIVMEIEYRGTNYFGFQIQEKKGKKEETIQGKLEEALRKLFRGKIRISCAGRTDRGVHAIAQVVNFKVATNIPLKNIKTALNSFFPPDIRIKKIKTVPLNFHARFSAKAKIYRYLILNQEEPSVFWQDFTWQVAGPLNLTRMRQAGLKLTGQKDFKLFAKRAKLYKHGLREIKRISVKKQGSLICIDIEASGFLRNMARNMITFLVETARAKLNLSDLSLILAGKTPYHNKPAPACGLYLYRVKY